MKISESKTQLTVCAVDEFKAKITAIQDENLSQQMTLALIELAHIINQKICLVKGAQS